MSTDRLKNSEKNKENKSSTASISTATGILPASTTSSSPSIWMQRDLIETRKILQAFWNKFMDEKNLKRHEDFKEHIEGFKWHLIFSTSTQQEVEKHKQIMQIFENAEKNKNFDLFCEAIQQYPLRLLYDINRAENLIPREIKETAHHIEESDIRNISEYMREQKISASVSLRADSGELITPKIPENQSSYAFAIHSVGKVFTGVLALRMVQEGVISESSLKEPLDEDFLKQLPTTLQSYLRENKTTLHQLMTHHSGLGDYLDNYMAAIRNALNDEKKPLEINQPKDFLKYAEEKTYPPGELHYSNIGSLLLGLAIKTAYEKKYGQTGYDKILHRYIIEAAKISCFSSTIPEHAKYNKEDKISPHIVGGPAGGYWTTAEDLAKFGKWIYEKCVADEKDSSKRPNLKKLMEDYGQEFYFPNRQQIDHGGTIPTASAHFTVSLSTGAVVSVLSDQPRVAIALQERIQENILSSPVSTSSTPTHDITKEKDPLSPTYYRSRG